MYKKISLEQNGHSPSSERIVKMFLKEFEDHLNDQFSEKGSLTCEILAINMSPCSIGEVKQIAISIFNYILIEIVIHIINACAGRHDR